MGETTVGWLVTQLRATCAGVAPISLAIRTTVSMVSQF